MKRVNSLILRRAVGLSEDEIKNAFKRYGGTYGVFNRETYLGTNLRCIVFKQDISGCKIPNTLDIEGQLV